MDAVYNDVQEWRYKDFLVIFGADPSQSKAYQVKCKQEAEDLFNDEDFGSAPYIQVSTLCCISYHTFFKADKGQFVELHMPKEDAPKAMKLTAEASARNNAKE